MNRPWTRCPWPIGEHASQTHAQTVDAGAAAEPIPFTNPVIHAGLTNREFLVSNPNTGSETTEALSLVRIDEPERAYRWVKDLQHIDRNGERWGGVVKCLVLERRMDDEDGIVFVEPPPDQCSFVAVKVLRKTVVDEHISDGGDENPYWEIAAMQAIGDGVHVINCIEALEDNDYLYIVAPCCEGGDIFSILHPQGNEHDQQLFQRLPGLPEVYARQRFREILECLHYLQSQGVYHCDISVENIMIHNGRCILIDLGLCKRVPLSATGHRVLSIPAPHPFGKAPYMAPEVYRGLRFDGFEVDMWSTGVTLFHMLTGGLIETNPAWVVTHHNLNNFIRFHCQIYSSIPPDEPAKWDQIKHINGVACNMMHLMLQEEPSTRLTLREVMLDAWVSSLEAEFRLMTEYLNQGF